MSIFTRLVNFLKEVRVELKKVNWPSREETFKYTMIVICISVAVGIFLGGLDKFYGFLMEKFLLK